MGKMKTSNFLEASPEFAKVIDSSQPSNNPILLIKRLKGANKLSHTIRVSKNESNIALNYKNEGIRVLLDFDGISFRKEIVMRLSKKCVDLSMFEENKILVIYKDNTLDLFKFQSFGHFEKIATCTSVYTHRYATTHSMVVFQNENKLDQNSSYIALVSSHSADSNLKKDAFSLNNSPIKSGEDRFSKSNTKSEQLLQSPKKNTNHQIDKQEF